MTGALLAVANWLDAIGIGGWARGSALVYPVANVVHVLALAMLLGAIAILDLRIAGLWRRLPLGALAAAIRPVTVIGMILLALSGTILFAADGNALAGSWVFHLKLIVIALAIANALAFEWNYGKRLSRQFGVRSLRMRGFAILSLILWASVAVLGRMIAYS